MPNQQASLFNFDDAAPTKKLAADATALEELVVGKQHPEAIAQAEINEEEIVELNFTTQPLATLQKPARGRMRQSDMAIAADNVCVPPDEILLSKQYYSIGAVAEMFAVNISLIRFWENEFDVLKPKKNGKGDRLFRPEDIKNLQFIYHLLREKQYTIPGAKAFLKANKKQTETITVIENLNKVKSFLLEIKASL